MKKKQRRNLKCRETSIAPKILIEILGNAIKHVLGLSEDEYGLAMLNLFRLKCCEEFKGSANAASIGWITLRADGEIEKFRITLLGYNLIDNRLN